MKRCGFQACICVSFVLGWCCSVGWAQEDWVYVGEPGFSAGGASYPDIALDSSGLPYVVYGDATNSSKARVMRFNGSAWQTVGTGCFSDGAALDTHIVLDSSDRPYVVYQDKSNSDKATVMRFDDVSSTWQTVGIAGFSTGQASTPSIALDSSNVPYVVFRDYDNSNRATVMRFVDGAWQTVGGGGFSAADVEYTDIALDSSDTPYVVYQDEYYGKATVMRFEGSTWQTVGTAGFSDGIAVYTNIALDSSDTPYVVYKDFGNSGKATVMHFNGSTWQTVGTAGFSNVVGSQISLALDSTDRPYVVYQDDTNYFKPTVMRFNSSAWQTIGTAGFSAGQATHPSIALDSSNRPYVVYGDIEGYTNKATVVTLGPVSTYSGGAGTETDPYQIATKQDLMDIADNPSHYNNCFIVTADIDLSGEVFAHAVVPGLFTGQFDGNGHVISHLEIVVADGTDYLGLFGEVGSGGKIFDLGMENVVISGLDSYLVGSITGSLYGLIQNCYATGILFCGGEVGGLVGESVYGSIENSYATAMVCGDYDYVGGLVGMDVGGNIYDCYATGMVIGTSYVGGLLGSNLHGTTTFTSCFWDVEKSGTSIGVGDGDDTGVTGLDTATMKIPQTFQNAGWDFDTVWGMLDSPHLQWEGSILNITIEGTGSVDLDPPGGLYEPDSAVQVTAQAEINWVFDHFSGDLIGSDIPATLFMDDDKSITAHFLLDTDGDGVADDYDLDDDDDGTPDDEDDFPLDEDEDTDTDGDGTGNNADDDDDDDCTPDDEDAFPLDSGEDTDTDGDGMGDNADPDDDNDGQSDADEIACGSDPKDAGSKSPDHDGDNIPDGVDDDDDNDGTPDSEDAFPLDPGEDTDTDGDGVGNNADPDDDNDGVPDELDPYPLDSTRAWTLTLSSSAGGSICLPGEGIFSYGHQEVVELETICDSLFEFSHFQGYLAAGYSPCHYTVRGDAHIRAVFRSVLDVLVVDANIPAGQYENGTDEYPFDSIQEAIEVAASGTTIMVRSGTYVENLELSCKPLILRGVDVNDVNDWAFPVIQGVGDGPVITVRNSHDPNLLLQGLVITQGEGKVASGLDCRQSQLTLTNCLIVANRCDTVHGQGGALRAYESQVNLINCTLSSNYGGWDGAALYADSNSVVMVMDSILWDNEPNEFYSDTTSEIVLQYSSLDVDPNFVSPGHWEHALNPGMQVSPSHTYAIWRDGDYHLDVNSAAIDAGDPNAVYDLEPEPKGGRVNQGAYGNTPQATVSPVDLD